MAASAIALVPARHSLRECIADVDRIVELIETLDDPDGELSPGAADQIQKDLIGALVSTKAKVDATSQVMARFEIEALAVKAEQVRLKARAAWLERQSERLAEYVLATLRASDLKKIEGNLSSFSVRKNPPSVHLSDDILAEPELLGWDYMRLPDPPDPTIDRAAIKKALQAGVVIEGASLVSSERLVRS